MVKQYRSFVALGLTLVAAALGGCASSGENSAGGGVDGDRLQVVATSRVLCDLTQQVAEDSVDLVCLLAPGQDPHTYQARPSDRQAVDSADLVLYDGYNFAPSVFNVVMASQNPAPRVAVLELAVPNPILGAGHNHDHGHDHDHSHDHEHDHDHGDSSASEFVAEETVPDPHVWHNARHNAAMAAVIADALSEVSPDQASRYRARADQLADEFTEIDAWIQAQVATVPSPNRRLVTPHDAFRYFAEAYGFEVKGALSGLNTDAQPSPRALTALVDQIKAATVPAIFAESTTNPALIQTVANNAGVTVAEVPLIVEGPEGPDSPAATTQAMLVINTCTIVNALGGTCDEAGSPLSS
ncbi:Mn transporter MntC [Leptolyngbya sp. BL0902]|uniref:metal ABC transporter solute-binding protein, Zn/Mn family n=1 Tax=Leptolyngbya sp. BL0902 TaxID=1115757 RepID=UPI0018E6E18B|nr:zinc ABC transporter substrate-binding protein [Leptolyngbya sp. BL0902]QQE64068.1 Mn transporter MntC [Leptolyngbya sp. BL0902]